MSSSLTGLAGWGMWWICSAWVTILIHVITLHHNHSVRVRGPGASHCPCPCRTTSGRYPLYTIARLRVGEPLSAYQPHLCKHKHCTDHTCIVCTNGLEGQVYSQPAPHDGPQEGQGALHRTVAGGGRHDTLLGCLQCDLLAKPSHSAACCPGCCLQCSLVPDVLRDELATQLLHSALPNCRNCQCTAKLDKCWQQLLDPEPEGRCDALRPVGPACGAAPWCVAAHAVAMLLGHESHRRCLGGVGVPLALHVLQAVLQDVQEDLGLQVVGAQVGGAAHVNPVPDCQERLPISRPLALQQAGGVRSQEAEPRLHLVHDTDPAPELHKCWLLLCNYAFHHWAERTIAMQDVVHHFEFLITAEVKHLPELLVNIQCAEWWRQD
mmetsp:Transcript_10974/g.23688  ORF Transcript_10974/g.23688 Transcript_10974/m.23688 type:complete len:379 (-) Transcript_10974:649-1785(-)